MDVTSEISTLKTYWGPRNTKFEDWYKILLLVDSLTAKGLESYATNEPMTFYNMAHYLLTKGELSHTTPIESETALELDRRARVNRGCQYMWSLIDEERRLGGAQSFIDELGFFLLVLGWYSVVLRFDQESGELQTDIWNPYETYPNYASGQLVSCVHSYILTEEEAVIKAERNGWDYVKRGTHRGEVRLDDYFKYDGGTLYNQILIDSKPVTGMVSRPEMRVIVSPVGGFPDRGSLSPVTTDRDWRKYTGRGIFEATSAVTLSFNKWKTMINQILRDTAQPITEEFSSTPQASPEQIRERGALFHYAPGEQGLVRVPPAAIPIELQANLVELRRELQKASFNDAVYGMVEGQPGYALSLLATSSANQILYPYMDAKHFIISYADKFWLTNLKTSRKVFEIKGRMIEKLKSTDIPDHVSIMVESDVATPKDWMERGTIANMLKEHLDDATIISEVLKFPDPQAIKRRRTMDKIMEHPVSQTVEMVSGYYAHADYLETRGDLRQAKLFRKAAEALEAQLGAQQPGEGSPAMASRVEAQRAATRQPAKPSVNPKISPPEARSGFTPQELRERIGRGTIRG